MAQYGKYQQAWCLFLFLILKFGKMKKINIIIIVLITLFLLKTVSAQVADSVNLKSNEFVKNNKFAVVFELGTIIGKSSMVERYNFLGKYHLYENFAIRAGGDFGVSSSESNFSYSALYQDFSSYSYDLYADLQYYFLRKSLVKPFITVGLFYSKDHFSATKYATDYDYYDYHNEWNLGVMSTFGVEIFLINNVSLVSEYIAKCYYTSLKRMYITSGSLSSYSDYKSKNVKFTVNTFRIGFSVYF
jgi:hypothetical protein